jgi:hypothetical protein
LVLNKVSSADSGDRVRPYLEGLELLASLPLDASVAGSESVPESGAYVDAVDGLLSRVVTLASAGPR